MSFIQFFRILWAQWRILAVAIIGALVAAGIAIKLMPTQYEATSRVMLDLVRPDPVSGEGIGAGAMRGYIRTQTELITDYRVAGRVVDQLQWTSSPVYLAAYRNRPKDDNRDFRRWVAQTVIDNTNVRAVEGSNILEISYRSTSGESARIIADAIRQAYIDQTLAFKRDSAGRTAQWFRQQAEELRTKLATAEKQMNDFEKANGVVLTADNSDTEEDRLRALASLPMNQGMSAPGIAAAQSPTQNQVAAIDAQIAERSRVLGPSHPQLLALQRQREVLASIAAKETAQLRSMAAGATQTGPSQNSLISAQQRIVLERRGKINEAERLATDVALLKQDYIKTAARAAELEQQAESPEAQLTLLGSAIAPTKPVSPKIPLILFGALGLGAALGVLCSLVVELLNRRIRGVEDLELVSVPIIGMMSRKSSNIAVQNGPELLRRIGILRKAA